jgi:hypothetical protein
MNSGLFIRATKISSRIAQNYMMVIKCLEMLWKEAVVAYS